MSRQFTVFGLAFGVVVLGTRTDANGGVNIDLADYAEFLGCMDGPGAGLELGCGVFDFDLDLDVDLADFAAFQRVFGASAPPGVMIDTVLVGDPGNEDDTWDDGFGGVGYVYNIGRFEVTAGQYAEFLNAVAATDAYGLYNLSMHNSQNLGCQITRNGSNGEYTYDFSGIPPGTTEAEWLHRPVNLVSWGDAARFANWLHNGQPTGAQDLSTTEDGSYFLNGAQTNTAIMNIDREPDATWVIPSENEWYKAAYYNGGVGTYYDYPTSNDTVPSNELVDPDPGNNATYGGFTIGGPYHRTVIGAHENSDSPYNTFDQGGNVHEWNEGRLLGLNRGVRGGSWLTSGSVTGLHATDRGSAVPTIECTELGFRVAEVP